MISLCLATRKRPEIFKKMCLSALDMALEPNDIEFVSYHDNDDNSVYEYIGNHQEVVGERIILNRAFNETQKIAKGDIYMFIADDCIFKTKGWDKRIKETFDEYPDKIVLVCPDNDNWGVWKFGVVGFLHKNWVDTVGYFLPPYKDGQSADRWLNAVAVEINRRVHLLDVIVEHVNIKDDVHQEKKIKGQKSKQTKRYWLPEMEEIRKKEIQLLRDFINKSK